MGKQTKKPGSKFGGEWTKAKLFIVDNYLKLYTKALKNQKFKKIYIDSFAGSGKVDLSNENNFENSKPLYNMLGIKEVNGNDIITGSPLIALQCDFDKYYFIEIDPDRLNELKTEVSEKYKEKVDKIEFINANCNERIKDIIAKVTKYDRCVLFIDPYAIELKWSTIVEISKCKGLDIIYLFPFSAINRLLPNNGEINDSNKKLINDFFGTTEWENELYKVNSETTLLGEKTEKNRIHYDGLVNFIEKRFFTIFKCVKTRMLYNSRRAPLFLLCFMMTNDSEKAQNLALKFLNIIEGLMKNV